MTQNVLPSPGASPPAPPRSRRGWAPFFSIFTAFFALSSGCDSRKPPRPRPLQLPGFSALAAAPSAPSAPAAPSSSAPLALERPADVEPDAPGPPGDLRAEVESFTDLRACARAHRVADPLLAESLDALGYDSMITDSCRMIEAMKARDVAPCAPALSTALRRRCEAQVAMFTGRPELCPTDEATPGAPERAPLCLAAARRDVRPCAALLGIERATCEGLAAHDVARCGLDARCLRLVKRWSDAIPAAEGRPIHAGRIQVEGPLPEPVDLAREAEAGAVVTHTESKIRLLIGDPRTFFVSGEIAGGGLLIDLPSWPPAEARLRRTPLEARVTLRHRSFGALELAHDAPVTVTFESAPAEPNRALRLRVETTVGPPSAVRKTLWKIDTWVRDVITPAP